MFKATGLPGWARGGMTAPSAEPVQDVAILKKQSEQLARALESIRQRIQEMESRPAGCPRP
jgi:hypothetical protein